MKSRATTVEEYLAELTPERRREVSAVRDVVLARLPAGFEEIMDFGMIAYVVPFRRCRETYNGHPLMYAAISSERRYVSVHLMSLYANAETKDRFVERYRATGKRLDMGKSCVRFRDLDDLPLELIGDAIGGTTVDEWVAVYEGSRPKRKKRKR